MAQQRSEAGCRALPSDARQAGVGCTTSFKGQPWKGYISPDIKEVLAESRVRGDLFCPTVWKRLVYKKVCRHKGQAGASCENAIFL